jgi:hypothetical protein
MLAAVRASFLMGQLVLSAPESKVCTPVKLVLVTDQTGSAPENRIAPVTASHVRVLLQAIAQCGGEMAIIGVTDDSRRPLERVVVERFRRAAPTRPPRARNPYDERRIRAAFVHDSTVYEQAFQVWRAHTNSLVDSYLRRISPILSRDAPRTDLCSALDRADVFLREDGWGGAAQSYALINSDGEENVRRRGARYCRTLPAATEILVVSGSGSLGVLADYPHHLFESLEPAIRWLNERLRRS